MNFEWDEVKEQLNIAKHSVDFSEAKSVFADEYGLVVYGLVVFDEEHSSDEERFCLLGISDKERILLVVHCYKDGDTIRIISVRKATAREKTAIRSKDEKRSRFY